ncbi:endolytic transglycosylase MltG [Leucobacter sp. CSA1]|uniref:Endolytic murein transglycosylase n=1 Tax=Leucobacter chromiisoli TaxID=2796471 RepID=A0A934Q689_9MICO|nr:endolytic transglycosylase MltG [Leucobacter chromiisoli]MBK0418168.1 endolytic transglycosylase MltG [Leucobacter chromiisoli]
MTARKNGRGGNGRRVAVVLTVTALLLGGLAAAGGYLWSQFGDRVSLALGWTSNDYEGEGSGEVIVKITEGEIGEDVARSLAEHDVVKTSDAFYELLLQQEPAVEFQPGAYQLRQQMSSASALAALQDPENRVQLSAMIPEGSTLAQTLEIVSSGTDIPLEELEEAAADPSAYAVPEGVDSLEGWLFPATYEFEFGATAHDVIARLVDQQNAVLDEFGVAEQDRQRVLTIAAMVQRESGTVEDFGKVSRVIHNRLDHGMLLQMDSTAQYGAEEHDDGSVWSTDEALADDNPWNTYVHSGLPAGPIANPGRDAIAATLEPTPGDWLYFVVSPGGTGASTFSSDSESHEAAVQEYRDWCSATPDSGC